MHDRKLEAAAFRLTRLPAAKYTQSARATVTLGCRSDYFIPSFHLPCRPILGFPEQDLRLCRPSPPPRHRRLATMDPHQEWRGLERRRPGDHQSQLSCLLWQGHVLGQPVARRQGQLHLKNHCPVHHWGSQRVAPLPSEDWGTHHFCCLPWHLLPQVPWSHCQVLRRRGHAVRQGRRHRPATVPVGHHPSQARPSPQAQARPSPEEAPSAFGCGDPCPGGFLFHRHDGLHHRYVWRRPEGLILRVGCVLHSKLPQTCEPLSCCCGPSFLRGMAFSQLAAPEHHQ